jgi:polyisoprenoid-binding protein YceI
MASTTKTLEQEIPVGAYMVDPVHSSVGFSVVHAGTSIFRSGFSSYQAHLSGGLQPRLDGTVEVASIEVPEEQLKGHLLAPEFFDAERYPTLRFESSALDVTEDGSVRVHGKLEIKGQEHEVEASGSFRAGGEYLDGSNRVGLSLAVDVDRRSFGLDWQAQLPGGGEALDWKVEITVELELVEEDE